VLLAGSLTLVGAGQAFAGYQLFINNQLVDQNGLFGARHSLTQVNGGTNVGLPGCINALNDGGGWAGTTICSSGGFGHAYCGCQLRYGWGGDDPNTAPNPQNVMSAEEYY
jgi:hypothetical protein